MAPLYPVSEQSQWKELHDCVHLPPCSQWLGKHLVIKRKQRKSTHVHTSIISIMNPSLLHKFSSKHSLARSMLFVCLFLAVILSLGCCSNVCTCSVPLIRLSVYALLFLYFKVKVLSCTFLEGLSCIFKLCLNFFKYYVASMNSTI